MFTRSKVGHTRKGTSYSLATSKSLSPRRTKSVKSSKRSRSPLRPRSLVSPRRNPRRISRSLVNQSIQRLRNPPNRYIPEDTKKKEKKEEKIKKQITLQTQKQKKNRNAHLQAARNPQSVESIQSIQSLQPNLLMNGNTAENKLARFMWSIGDRYHDWWPADRGDIKSFKKCGDWKFLPSILRYGVICDSIIAFRNMSFGIIPYDNFNKLNSMGLTPMKSPHNKSYTSNILTSLKKYTLGHLNGKGDIENIILEKYTSNRIEDNIARFLLKEKITQNNLLEAIKKYRDICKNIFGKQHTYEWFAVICDAGIGPFCDLFKNIIENVPKNDIKGIIAFCKRHHIPVMYMIKTPQTFADSSTNMSFIPCLVLFRFPITHKIDGTPISQAITRNNDHPKRVPIRTDYDGVFRCNFSYFSQGYTIQFEKGDDYGYELDEGLTFNYKIYNNTDNSYFDIQYGKIQDVKYRYVGPSLFDLMLHYLHLNLSSTRSIYNQNITVGNTVVQFDKITTKNVEYKEDENDENDSSNISVEYVNINDKLHGSIHTSIDSALGLLPKDNQRYKGSKTELTYKPTNPISLSRINGYDFLPPSIMIDIKHEGDASQVVAAELLNNTHEFKDRIVFISRDRSCVAHSSNKGLPTILFNGNGIFLYNYKYNPRIKTRGGSYDNCNECLDIKELMLSIGMYATAYLKQCMKQQINNPILHKNVLDNLYSDICNIYNEYNMDLENDINIVYDSNHLNDFMVILHKLYYNTSMNSMQALIRLSDIYQYYYYDKVLDNMQNIRSENNEKNIGNNVGTHVDKKVPENREHTSPIPIRYNPTNIRQYKYPLFNDL